MIVRQIEKRPKERVRNKVGRNWGGVSEGRCCVWWKRKGDLERPVFME